MSDCVFKTKIIKLIEQSKFFKGPEVFQRFSVFLDQNAKADVFEEVNSVDVTEYLRIVADNCFFVFSFFEKIEIDILLK